jgi:phage tail sheath protein FI
VNLGGRTTDAADVLAIRWKYVPVRRLAVYVEESLLRGVQWAVFEPNDEPRRAHLRMNLTSFMQTYFARSVAGRAPREA